MPVKPDIIPTFCYADAPAAIDFLCNAFGFERYAVHADDKDPGIIQHAQLVLDGNMIMLSSVRDSEYRSKGALRSVAEAGGNTLGLYVVIDDVDGHAARAHAAGAEIFMAPEDQDYGGRCYSVRDCEGHVWSFGSYDPRAKPA
jgi:uncharacterized glyoxalase superfamily protein PhnB